MQKLKFKRFTYSYNSLIDISLILLVGLLSITWFRGNFLIYHGDQCLPLSPIKDFQNFNYCWNHLMVTGFLSPPGFATFFYFGFFALMEFLGFSLVASENIFYYFLFTASGLSMYYLTTIFTNKNNRHLIGLASVLFYMFNFFPILMFWSGFSTLAIFYSLMPLILALYIKLLNTEMGITSCVGILFSIAILTWATMAPTYILDLFLVSFLYLIYFIFENYKDKRKIKTAFGLSIFLIFFYLLLNMWWLIPAFYGARTFSVATGTTIPEESLGIFSLWSTSFLSLFRLLTPWTFDISLGDFLFPWAWVYSTAPFLILGFIPPILAFIPFLLKQKNRAIFYFGSLFLLGLFLMKGTHFPLSQINKWLFLNIPFFVFFRNPYEKFGPIVVLSYAVLIGIGFNVLYVSLKKYSKNLAKIIVGLFSFLIFVVYMWPFWTGDLIYAGGKTKPSARVRIPDYYYEAKEWLSQQQEQVKILSLPHQEGVCYDWEYGYVGSDDPTIRLFQRPVLTTYVPSDGIVGSYLSNLLGLFTKPMGSKNIVRILGLTNIKYILLHNDINYHINTPNPEIKAKNIKSILDSQIGIRLEKSFGRLDFYRVADEYFLPHIYTSSSSARELLEPITNQQLQVTNEEPEIIFKKINPTKYLVKVKKAKDPFWLVFSESFHKQWRLYRLSTVGCQLSAFDEIVANYPNLKVKEARHLMKFTPQDIQYLFKKPLTNQHYLVNGYANAWFVEPKKIDLPEDFTLVIYFWPQSLFYLGLLISSLTLIGCVGYLLWPKILRLFRFTKGS